MSMLLTLGGVGYLAAVAATGIKPENLGNFNINSSAQVINAVRIEEIISNLVTFTGTALLFAYLTHPKPSRYLGFTAPKSILNIIISIVLALTMIPLGEQLEYYLRMINLGPSVIASQQKMDDAFKAILNMPTPKELLTCLLMTGIVAPLGEELLFRGIVMRFGSKLTHRLFASAIISGLFFAIFHAQVYAFLPIMLAGVVLSYIYYYNGSIWANIITHCIYNSIQVIIIYIASHNYISSHANLNDMDHYPLYLVIAAALVFVACFYALRRNRTPLPPDWANDFRDEQSDVTQRERFGI